MLIKIKYLKLRNYLAASEKYWDVDSWRLSANYPLKKYEEQEN